MSRRLRVAALSMLVALGCSGGGEDRVDDGKADRPGEAEQMLESIDDVERLVREVVADSYPELAEATIAVETFGGSDAYFFRARPGVSSLLNPFVPTRYLVEVNEALFETGAGSPPDISISATRAILAHELAHVADYVTGGRTAILAAAWTQLSGKAEVRAERRTDLDTIRRGYVTGLQAYRVWIYQFLSEDDLARKKQVYFTPPEIAAVASGIAEFPELFDTWTEDPPLSIDEIDAAVSALEAGREPETDTPCSVECFDGTCISATEVCDGMIHCDGGEDEAACETASCAAGEWECFDGACVAGYFYCDGVSNCADGSDELSCAD